jgi:hypothetical protein
MSKKYILMANIIEIEKNINCIIYNIEKYDIFYYELEKYKLELEELYKFIIKIATNKKLMQLLEEEKITEFVEHLKTI